MKKAILILLMFTAFINVNAQEAFYIKNFNVGININNDGSIDVIEKINVFFNESRRGIIRKYHINMINSKIMMNL